MEMVTSQDGARIAFDRMGDGPPLIEVMGATATRAMAGQDIEHLAQDFTIFTYDRRGRGDSSDRAPYAVAREIEDLAALIEEAGGSAFVLGHSSGAVLALEAAKQGLPIRKLALYEPPFIIDDSRPPLPSDYVSQLRRFIAEGRPESALEYFMTVAVGIPAEYIGGMKNSPYWQRSVAAAHTISYDGEIMGDTMRGNPDTLARFAGVTIPTLVMVGSESPPYQQNAVQTLANLLPNGYYRSMEGQDHGVAAEVLAPVLAEFFLS